MPYQKFSVRSHFNLMQKIGISAKKINALLYSFVRKGKDKVKRTILINPLEEGGLKIPEIVSMISTQRIMSIKRFLGTYPVGRKSFLIFILKTLGADFCFTATSITKNYQLLFQFFIKNVFKLGLH